MSKPDRIKVSMEFNIMGNGIWLTAESPVAPDEDILEEFKKGRDLLVQSFKAMDEGSLRVFGSIPPEAPNHNDKELESEITKQFEVAKQRVMKAKTKELAEAIIIETGFTFNVELKSIANSKPSNNVK